MQKVKRILAMIGVILLALLYLSTVAFAILGRDFMNWLMASVVATIMIPVLIWAYGFIYRLLKGDNNRSNEDKNNTETGRE